MRKLIAPLLVLILVGFSTGFPMNLDAAKHDANTTSPAEFKVEVKNDMGEERRFRLNIDGIKESWWFYNGETRELKPGESTVFDVEVNVTPTTIQKNYTFTIRAKTLENQTESIDTYFTVNRTRGLAIRSFELDREQYRSGERVEAELEVFNTESQAVEDYQLYFKVVGETVDVETEDLPTGRTTLEPVFELPENLENGDQTVEAVVEHNDYRESASITLDIQSSSENPENMIAKNILTSNNIVTRSETVKITNNGDTRTNVRTKNTVSFFYLPFTSLEPEPESQVTEGWTTELVWTQTVQPEETASFGYTVHYWMPVTLLAFLIVGLIVLNRMRQKHVVNKTGKLTDSGATIYLEIKNKSVKPLKDFEVRDFIPGMVTVKEEFDTVEPEIENTDHGTRLSWKVDEMEPGETRVLTYKLKSDLEVESEIILPKAEIVVDGKQISESSKIDATFHPKEST